MHEDEVEEVEVDTRTSPLMLRMPHLVSASSEYFCSISVLHETR